MEQLAIRCKLLGSSYQVYEIEFVPVIPGIEAIVDMESLTWNGGKISDNTLRRKTIH